MTQTYYCYACEARVNRETKLRLHNWLKYDQNRDMEK